MIIIAVDGRAASGKSTMARELADILKAGIVHTDDFFLPKELRSRERLAQAGGNFHHERFAQEILPQLRSGEEFSYNVFDCGVMKLNGRRVVAKSPVRIVEGAYSCHPVLGNYMDLRIFKDIPAEEQLTRIRLRNGEEQARVFAEKWIPLEEKYIKEYRIKENADTIL